MASVPLGALFGEGPIKFGEIGQRQGIAYCLRGARILAVDPVPPARGVTLFGAAASVHPGDWPFSGVRDEYDAGLAAARAGLTAEAFAAAWAAGQATPLEEAIVLALGQPAT